MQSNTKTQKREILLPTHRCSVGQRRCVIPRKERALTWFTLTGPLFAVGVCCPAVGIDLPRNTDHVLVSLCSSIGKENNVGCRANSVLSLKLLSPIRLHSLEKSLVTRLALKIDPSRRGRAMGRRSQALSASKFSVPFSQYSER